MSSSRSHKKVEPTEKPPAVSFGKPSLKARLESYYSLTAPEQIADKAAWRCTFDKIWEKYGGDDCGEKKLASKLAKKYGSHVQLQLPGQSNTEATNFPVEKVEQFSEDWYTLNDKERKSGSLDFASITFDPIAALLQRNKSILLKDPSIAQAPILDRVDQFRCFLPPCDPLHREATKRSVLHKTATKSEVVRKKKLPTCFASTAEPHETGPLSVLYKAFVQKRRVRVVTRYSNGIRGTLTGYLKAFDKHFNLILQDVDENYTPATSDEATGYSKAEQELQRRLDGMKGLSVGPGWTNRQRHMKQMVVRGDSVVIVYISNAEYSAWPATNKSPTVSQYRSSHEKSVQANRRVGTPGSLVYAQYNQQRETAEPKR